MRNHFLRAGGIPSTTLIDPYISGKLHYYKQTSEHDDGAFGAFWVHSSGATEQNVYINPTGISQFLERSATIQTDEDVTDAEGAWKSFEIDLSGVTSPGRIVFYARRVDGTDYRCDFGLDDIKLYAANGTVVNFDPSSSSVRTSNLWVRLNEAKSGITSYSTAKTNHPASSGWEAVVLEDEGGLWNWGQGDTNSGGTGPDAAANDSQSTYYVFWESSTSSGNGLGGGGGSYLRWNSEYNLTTGAAV